MKVNKPLSPREELQFQANMILVGIWLIICAAAGFFGCWLGK